MGLLTIDKSGIDGGDLSNHHADRPAVADDVMHSDNEDVFKFVQLQEPGSEQVVAREVKGPVSFLSSDGLSAALAFVKVEMREVSEVKRMNSRGRDDLN